MTTYYVNTSSGKYNVGLKALSKYNRLAYKKVILEVIPQLKEGMLLGESADNINYSLNLPCTPKFTLVHGQLQLKFYVDHTRQVVYLESIEPYDKLLSLYRSLVDVREGVPITDKRDLFKLRIIKSLEVATYDNSRTIGRKSK